jgi:hypothetical protein
MTVLEVEAHDAAVVETMGSAVLESKKAEWDVPESRKAEPEISKAKMKKDRTQSVDTKKKRWTARSPPDCRRMPSAASGVVECAAAKKAQRRKKRRKYRATQSGRRF